MTDCLFCKIIQGEIPSRTIYEDDLIKVIMNINPNTNGHLLIIPKEHYTNILDIDEKIITHYIFHILNPKPCFCNKNWASNWCDFCKSRSFNRSTNS